MFLQLGHVLSLFKVLLLYHGRWISVESNVNAFRPATIRCDVELRIAAYDPVKGELLSRVPSCIFGNWRVRLSKFSRKREKH